MSDYVISVDLNGRIGKVVLPEDATEDELYLMEDLMEKAIKTRIKFEKTIAIKKNPLKADIYDLELSVRLTNVLKRAGCNTVSDVLSHSKDEIARFRNIGRNSYEECIKVFSEFGDFKEEVEEDE